MINAIKLLVLLVFVLILPKMAEAEQYLIFSEQCPAGDEEAQKLFKQAQDKRFGRGMVADLEEAFKLYNQAAEKGSVRALYDLGTLYEQRPGKSLNAEDQEKVILEYYIQAAAAGCPEAKYKLYSWGEYQAENSKQNIFTQNASRQNATTQKIYEQLHLGFDKFLLEAANEGALVAMFELGRKFIQQGEREKAAAWLQRALDLGYGSAAEPLSRMQFEQKNMREGIGLLRQGARLGSIACLHRLAWIYSRGQYNQMRDPEYAQCFTKIITSINPDAPPELVPDLDELCPPRRVFTY